MQKDKTLLIMAAGMGSRFGGLKQIEPVGPNGEFIIDYSIYDAIRCGFNKVVFVIKEENYDIFRDTIGKRIENKVKVEYVFQKLEDLPTGIDLPIGREKPWGTGQAILAAKDKINEHFAVINADDYYGYNSFKVLADHIDNSADTKNEYAMVGYLTGNTLSENGSVKRGVCEQQNGYLSKLTECSVETVNDEIIATALEKEEVQIITSETLVSMNMFGFTPGLFEILEKEFKEFLLKNDINNDLKCEFLIPTILQDNIDKNNITVKVLKTDSVWYGITYQEDKSIVLAAIEKFIQNKLYAQNLWED